MFTFQGCCLPDFTCKSTFALRTISSIGLFVVWLLFIGSCFSKQANEPLVKETVAFSRVGTAIAAETLVYLAPPHNVCDSQLSENTNCDLKSNRAGCNVCSSTFVQGRYLQQRCAGFQRAGCAEMLSVQAARSDCLGAADHDCTYANQLYLGDT